MKVNSIVELKQAELGQIDGGWAEEAFLGLGILGLAVVSSAVYMLLRNSREEDISPADRANLYATGICSEGSCLIL